MADWLKGFIPMRMHVLIRFGRWQNRWPQRRLTTPPAFSRGDCSRASRRQPLPGKLLTNQSGSA